MVEGQPQPRPEGKAKTSSPLELARKLQNDLYTRKNNAESFKVLDNVFKSIAEGAEAKVNYEKALAILEVALKKGKPDTEMEDDLEGYLRSFLNYIDEIELNDASILFDQKESIKLLPSTGEQTPEQKAKIKMTDKELVADYRISLAEHINKMSLDLIRDYGYVLDLV